MEMTQINRRWETSVIEQAMRADLAEKQTHTAILEAKGWEGKFTDLNEAIWLLAKQINVHKARGSSTHGSLA